MNQKRTLLILLIFNSLLASAQLGVDTLTLSEITVTSMSEPIAFVETSRIVTVINRQQLRNAAVSNIADILRVAASVDVRDRGGDGVQSDVSVRGGSFEQTQILLNGIPINDAQTGHHNMDLPVSLDDVERIEILEGTASRTFGSNGFAGAINIVTISGDQKHVQANISAGSNNYWKANVGISQKINKLNTYLSGTYSKSDGFTENTDFIKKNVFFHANLKTKIGVLGYQFGWQNRGFGANSFYAPQYPNQYEKTSTFINAISLRGGQSVQYKSNLYWRRHLDEFQLFRNNENAPTWYKSHNYHQTDGVGSDLIISKTLNHTLLSVGTNFRFDKIYSNVLGIAMENPKGNYSKQKSTQSAGFVADIHYEWEKFTFSAGGLLHWNSDFSWQNYFGADANFQITKQLKIYTSINKTYRLPSFTERFYSSTTFDGNQLLTPEYATNYEFGAKYFSPIFRAHISTFYRDGNNIIAYVRATSAEKWKATNMIDVQTYGIESSVNINVNQLFNNALPIEFVSFQYSLMNRENNSNTLLTNYSTDFLKHNLTVSIQHRIFAKLRANWSIQYQQRNGEYAPYDRQTNKFLSAEKYKPVCLVNAKLFYQFKYCQLYAEANNLLDVDYEDIANVPSPDFSLKIGVKIGF